MRKAMNVSKFILSIPKNVSAYYEGMGIFTDGSLLHMETDFFPERDDRNTFSYNENVMWERMVPFLPLHLHMVGDFCST
jgi:hypothetical protein